MKCYLKLFTVRTASYFLCLQLSLFAAGAPALADGRLESDVALGELRRVTGNWDYKECTWDRARPICAIEAFFACRLAYRHELCGLLGIESRMGMDYEVFGFPGESDGLSEFRVGRGEYRVAEFRPLNPDIVLIHIDYRDCGHVGSMPRGWRWLRELYVSWWPYQPGWRLGAGGFLGCANQ